MDDAWTMDAFKCAWSHGVLLYYADYPAYVCTFHSTRNRMLLIILEECTFTILHRARQVLILRLDKWIPSFPVFYVSRYLQLTHTLTFESCSVAMSPPAEWGSDSPVSVTWSVVSSSFSCSVASSRQCTVGRARWSPVQWSGPGHQLHCHRSTVGQQRSPHPDLHQPSLATLAANTQYYFQSKVRPALYPDNETVSVS